MTSTPYSVTDSLNRLTDSGGGTTGSTIAAGVGVYNITLPIKSLDGLGTSAIDIMTEYVPGHRFKVLGWDFITTVAGTGSGASQVFNLEIGSTNLTGGGLTVTLAATAAVGAKIAGAAITGANTGSATDKLSVEMAASGTAFTAGQGYFLVKVQNLDTADAFASLAAIANLTSTV